MSKTLHYLANLDLFRLLKMPFYAVAKGRVTGIYNSWGECEAQVKGFSGARYKKFDSASAANEFIKANAFSGQTFARPSTSRGNHFSSWNNNLKRPYSPSSSSNSSYNKKSKKYYSESSGSDLEDMINKQLDDVEKRLKDSTKRLEKLTRSAPKVCRIEPKRSILIEPPLIDQQAKRNNNNFEQDNEGYVQVYTDGACSGNGKRGARVGLGVYWRNKHPFNRSEPVSGRPTNNCGEIQAATMAIKTAYENGVTKLAINTDSQFLIKSVTKWLPGWKSRGWRLASGKSVKNESDFKELDSVLNKVDIKWNYVEAHNGLYGNEMADKFAKAGAALYVNKN